MNRHEAARTLLRKAEQDERTVERLIDHVDIADEIVGFHCQQAVEKLLKALLLLHGLDFPRTHNLDALADLLTDAGHPLPDNLGPLEGLIPFAAQYRYEEEPDLRIDRASALALVRRLRAHAEASLDAPES